MSLGFEQAGFDIVASVEYDPVHAAVHRFNFPLTEVACADVAHLSSSDLLEAARRGMQAHISATSLQSQFDVDVIIGGPPCQGFSTIGKSLAEDDRNALVFQFLRLVVEIRPRYFVMENVPGIASSGNSRNLEKLILEFQKAGYSVNIPYRILNAADFGVPQDRRRLFLLGAREGSRMPVYPRGCVNVKMRRSESKRIQPTLELHELPNGPTVWEAIGDLPDLDEFEYLDGHDEVRLPESMVATMEARASSYVRRLRGLESDPLDFSYRRTWCRELLTSSMRTFHTELCIRRFSATSPGDTEPTSRFLKLEKEGLCNTLRSGTGSERGAYTSPRPLHPSFPRVISVREAARLHSYPDWFRFHATKWHGFRQVGNSVPPLLARSVAREIMKVLGTSTRRPTRIVGLTRTDLLGLNRLEAAKLFGADVSQIPKSRQREMPTAI